MRQESSAKSTESGTRHGRLKELLPLLVLIPVVCALVVGLQVANHAYESEFGRTWDEAAHYVTGLMVYDFIRFGEWSDPMGFAEDYYLHYPKVALGHWPPLFYLTQALWFCVFPPSRLTLMLLIAALTSVLALITWTIGRRELGDIPSGAAALVLVTLPLTQYLSSVAMAEMLLAVLAMLAAVTYGRYLDSSGWRWSVLFGLLAAAAILVKPNALALAFVPPVALALSGRWALVRKASFWLPLAIVLLLCGPWYALTLEMMKNGPLESAPQFWYSVAAVQVFSLHLVSALGWGIFALALIGLWLTLRERRSDARPPAGKWIGLASVVISTLLFHWIIPASFESRHIFMALAPAILFAVIGLQRAAEWMRWPGSSRAARMSVLAGLVLLLYGLTVWRIPLKKWVGFGAVSEYITDQPRYADSIILVVSESQGEGALVAEVASRDDRPNRIVLRGSKVLVRSDWLGTDTEVLFADTEQLFRYLQQVPVGLLALDESTEGTQLVPERQIVTEMLAEHGDVWQEIESFPITRRGRTTPRGIRLFEQRGHQLLPRGSIEVDLEMMLGKTLSKVDRGDVP